MMIRTHEPMEVLRALSDRTDVLLEGGPTLAGAFLRAGAINRILAYVAPILLGGCYLLGVSTRRMERLVETLGVTKLSKSQVSIMAKRARRSRRGVSDPPARCRPVYLRTMMIRTHEPMEVLRALSDRTECCWKEVPPSPAPSYERVRSTGSWPTSHRSCWAVRHCDRRGPRHRRNHRRGVRSRRAHVVAIDVESAAENLAETASKVGGTALWLDVTASNLSKAATRRTCCSASSGTG